MTTTQPAALPENFIFSERLAISEAAQVQIDAECCRIIQATLDYIRSNYALAALQPQPAAAVSDAEIQEIARGKSNHIEFARAILALRPQAVPMTWPKARDVGRFGDMHPADHLRVGLDSDNDVYVSVWGEKGGASVEFCNPGGGGGGSSKRTREALIALMAAMEADNAERPDKDWWARRNGITAQGAQGGEA